MVQRLPLYVIILIFTIFVAVSAVPTYNNRATQARTALKYFDPRKASYERRTDQSSPVDSHRRPRPKPSERPHHHHHHHHHQDEEQA